jgi:hypothetical protein
MIKAIVVVNNHGKVRLSKFYSPVPVSQQQQIVKDLFGMVSKRSDGVCNFVEDASFGKGTKVMMTIMIYNRIAVTHLHQGGVPRVRHAHLHIRGGPERERARHTRPHTRHGVLQRAPLQLERGNVFAGGGV